MRRRQSHYHPSGSSFRPDITTEGFDAAALFTGHDEQDEVETKEILDLPAELHVPSQAPSLSQAGFRAMSFPTSSATHAQSSMQAQHERQFAQNETPGQATRTAEVHPSDTFITHDLDTENQGSLNQGQGYYLVPPATERFSEPPAVSFVEPSGRVAHSCQTAHNSVSATHGSLQSRNQQVSSLPSSSTAYSDLRRYFPLENDDHRKKRDALKAVMQSPWKQNNEIEPEASLLLQFMLLDPTEGRWYCTFWKGGRPCDCSCKKRDHAKGHIRSHIDLLPFVCNSRCPHSATGCARRYPAVEPLQKHRKGKTTCDHCGDPFLPGNMKRHVQIRHPEV